MNYKNTLALLPALILAACGGDEQTMNQPALPGSLIYSFPADGQAEVSPKAKPVLRFANALTEDEATLAGKILINGQANQASVTLVDGGRSLELTPNAGLSL
ncbi:MAG TPA: Ig-like domain-containing protein, partial [Marinobacter sp.]